MLLSTPASILAAYIKGQGLMSNPAANMTWPLYISRMPDGVGVKTNVGCIYNAPGKKDGRLMIGLVIQHYGLQVLIRCRTHNDGWLKMEAMATNLDTVHNVEITVDGEDYQIQNISRVEPIVSLGTEEGTKKRQLFEGRFLATIKRL